MKKRVLGLCLSLALGAPMAGAAFTDISDPALQQTAEVLSALGIMQGVGGSSFAPQQPLTRAQFCKLAVTAMGITGTEAYSSYTIFPDVQSTHWAVQYVNAAMRHPKVQERRLIRGYADGTFGPERTVSYGEVCTMLLRMLGYQETDIGPFWPNDYIARANTLGLTKGVTIEEADAPVTRAAAAVLLQNVLQIKGKDEAAPLLDGVASGTEEQVILLATKENASDLASNEAIFFQNGQVDKTPRKTVGTLSSSLIGVQGTAILSKDNGKPVLGMLENQNRTETYQVVEASPSKLETTEKTLKPDNTTLLWVGSAAKADTYGSMWAELREKDTLRLFYDENGKLVLMAVLSSQNKEDNLFVYQPGAAAPIPSGFAIIKNGAPISRDKLKPYDVVRLDTAAKTAYVSSARFGALYEMGTPSYRAPQRVTLFGQEYPVHESGMDSFADVELGKRITVLMDDRGTIAAAYPESTLRAETTGIVTSVDPKSGTTVALLGGGTLTLAAGEQDSALLGRYVYVGQRENGTAYLSERTLSGKQNGDWKVDDGKLGVYTVSDDVQIYEQIQSGGPMNALTRRDLAGKTIASANIRVTVQDASGSIVLIVLDDIIGKNVHYGIATTEREIINRDEDGEGYEIYFLRFRYWNGTAEVNARYRLQFGISGLYQTPAALPMGYHANDATIHRNLTPTKLLRVGEVARIAFSGEESVRLTDGTVYPLLEDIGVYLPERKVFISLHEAKSNYTKFTLYANKAAQQGGKVCLITAS